MGAHTENALFIRRTIFEGVSDTDLACFGANMVCEVVSEIVWIRVLANFDNSKIIASFSTSILIFFRLSVNP